MYIHYICIYTDQSMPNVESPHTIHAYAYFSHSTQMGSRYDRARV